MEKIIIWEQIETIFFFFLNSKVKIKQNFNKESVELKFETLTTISIEISVTDGRNENEQNSWLGSEHTI